MIFGRQPQGHAATFSSFSGKSVHGRMRGLWWLFATLLFLVPLTLTAGCGGSSSSSPGSSGGARNATITGRLLDVYNNNAPVVGATITYNGVSAFSGADGTFSLQVASGVSGANLYVISPSTVAYWNTGQVSGQPVDLRNTGVTIPALTSNQVYSVGDISLYSQSGPPPPPIFP
jgi:hypothetical protein